MLKDHIKQMTTIHYVTKPFDSLSEKTIHTLSMLSFRNGFGITADIDLYYDYKYKKNIQKTKTWTAVIAKCNNIPIGWAMIRNMKKSSYMMFYVKPTFRRLGIGKKLFELSKQYLTKKGKNTSIVFPHDYQSEGFFNKSINDLKTKKFGFNKCRIYLKSKKV